MKINIIPQLRKAFYKANVLSLSLSLSSIILMPSQASSQVSQSLITCVGNVIPSPDYIAYCESTFNASSSLCNIFLDNIAVGVVSILSTGSCPTAPGSSAMAKSVGSPTHNPTPTPPVAQPAPKVQPPQARGAK